MIKEPNPQDVKSPTGHFSQKHGPDALKVVPEARGHIADTITYFSEAEANIRIFLLGSFGSDLEAAEELLKKAKQDHFVDALLPLAVSVRKRPDMKQATASFIAARTKVKRHRDTFAHGVFASRSDLPDSVLVMRADPNREDHLDTFNALASGRLDSTLFQFRFQSWSATDFRAASSMAVAYLNASHAMSVCFGRGPEEVDPWRSALERQGLLEEPPHSAFYRRGSR